MTVSPMAATSSWTYGVTALRFINSMIVRCISPNPKRPMRRWRWRKNILKSGYLQRRALLAMPDTQFAMAITSLLLSCFIKLQNVFITASCWSRPSTRPMSTTSASCAPKPSGWTDAWSMSGRASGASIRPRGKSSRKPM